MKRMSSKIISLILSGVVFAALGLVSPSYADTGVGTVKSLEGSAVIIRGDERIPAVIGASVNQSDVIETSANSSIGILFKDDTQFSLGSNSRATIDEYVYNADETGSMVTKLWKGTMGFITGKVGKNSPENVKIETPAATIGIRGTFFVVSVEG